MTYARLFSPVPFRVALAALTLAFLAVTSLVFATPRAEAQSGPLQLTLREGVTGPIPIAVLDFQGGDARSAEMGQRIAQVIANDLQSSGLFRVVNNAAIRGSAGSALTAPNLPAIQAVTDALGLVGGEVAYQPDGNLVVGFRLWDIIAQRSIEGFEYRNPPSSWRAMAHAAADAIYSRLIGEPGYFSTQIVFVDESGPKNARRKRLAVMDYDGENVRYLTGGNDLVLTPRYSPTAPEITYITYRSGLPRVYLLNVETQQQEILGKFPGMTFAPRFSPDGRRVILSLSRGGNTDIYEMDLRSRNMRRLTRSPGIDTAPSYSPDGQRIVFESDRGGSQQLYVMNVGGGGEKRISFGGGRYATPVWSPKGDKIAFTKMQGGRFSIGVMGVDGSAERVLTSSFLDEGPTWSPNGRKLMFFRDSPGQGGPQLYEVDLRGGDPRAIRTPSAASDPAWGPS